MTDTELRPSNQKASTAVTSRVSGKGVPVIGPGEGEGMKTLPLPKSVSKTNHSSPVVGFNRVHLLKYHTRVLSKAFKRFIKLPRPLTRENGPFKSFSDIK